MQSLVFTSNITGYLNITGLKLYLVVLQGSIPNACFLRLTKGKVNEHHNSSHLVKMTELRRGGGGGGEWHKKKCRGAPFIT